MQVKLNHSAFSLKRSIRICAEPAEHISELEWCLHMPRVFAYMQGDGTKQLVDVLVAVSRAEMAKICAGDDALEHASTPMLMTLDSVPLNNKHQ